MSRVALLTWREYPLPDTGGAGQISLRAGAGIPRYHGHGDLLVALPPGYGAGERTYPVVYLHDGQNLFDPATSYARDWGLVAGLNRLSASGLDAIVVGIPNRGRRRRYEYSPFRDILHGGGGGDRYLAFLVETIKPLIDASFRTRPGRSHTVIAGSSLGGLISLYALYRHADRFGAAGVLSPALWFADRAMFPFLAQQAAPAAGECRIHLDVGTEEGPEALEDVRALRRLLRDAGYRPGGELSYVEDPGGRHEEAAWGRRFCAALPFLLGSEGGA